MQCEHREHMRRALTLFTKLLYHRKSSVICSVCQTCWWALLALLVNVEHHRNSKCSRQTADSEHTLTLGLLCVASIYISAMLLIIRVSLLFGLKRRPTTTGTMYVRQNLNRCNRSFRPIYIFHPLASTRNNILRRFLLSQYCFRFTFAESIVDNAVDVVEVELISIRKACKFGRIN